MIVEIPNFVSENELVKIKSLIDLNSDLFDKTLIGSYREGDTLRITELSKQSESLSELDAILKNIFSVVSNDVLSRRFRPDNVFQLGDVGYQYHKYKPGDIAHVHGDGEVTSDGLLRYASVVLNLNTVSDGGDLVFPSQNKFVKTEAGKIVAFPPYNMFQHYTTPSSQDREVIVTWFIYSNVKIQYL